MKLSNKTRVQLTIQKTVFLILFISIIGMLAWITNNYNKQFDLTANKRHSLSNSSSRLLNTLDTNITVHAYTNDDITKKAIAEIIGRYQNIKPDFNLRLLNPDIDIAQAQQDGIVMNKSFAFVIHHNNKMEHINSLSETAISNALLRLSRHDDQQIVFLRGHGERDIEGNNNRAYSKINKQLESKGFDIQSINLLENTLPDNTKLVVIAAPSHDYLDGEVEKIQAYLEEGGNLLWLVDPGKLYGLKKIATSLGLQLQEGVIVDNNTDLRSTLNIDHPAIIPVTEYAPHIITNTIQYNTLFPITRGISPLTNETTVNHWQAEVLFNSFGKSWTEVNGVSEEMVFDSSSGDIAGPITIAVALHRNSKHSNKKSAQQSQRIIVVGDSDFLSDTYLGAGANLSLGMNMFNWLTGDDDLISVEVKPSPDTKLELNDLQLMIIAFGFFLIIPALLLIIGARIWYKRKSQ